MLSLTPSFWFIRIKPRFFNRVDIVDSFFLSQVNTGVFKTIVKSCLSYLCSWLPLSQDISHADIVFFINHVHVFNVQQSILGPFLKLACE